MLTPNQAAALRTLLDTGAAPQDAVIRKALIDSGAAEFAGVLFRPTAAAERVLADGEAEYASGLAQFAARFARDADKIFDEEHGQLARRAAAEKARKNFRWLAQNQASRDTLGDTSRTWTTQRVKEDYFRLASALREGGYEYAEAIHLTQQALVGRGEFSTDVAIAAELYSRSTMPDVSTDDGELTEFGEGYLARIKARREAAEKKES